MKKKKNNTGYIIGIAVACIIVFMLVRALIIYFA